MFAFRLFCFVLFSACRYFPSPVNVSLSPLFYKSPNFDPAGSHRVIYQFYGWSDQTGRLSLSLQCNLVKSGIPASVFPACHFDVFSPLRRIFFHPMGLRALLVPYSLPSIYSQNETNIIVPPESTHI